MQSCRGRLMPSCSPDAKSQVWRIMQGEMHGGAAWAHVHEVDMAHTNSSSSRPVHTKEKRGRRAARLSDADRPAWLRDKVSSSFGSLMHHANLRSLARSASTAGAIPQPVPRRPPEMYTMCPTWSWAYAASERVSIARFRGYVR